MTTATAAVAAAMCTRADWTVEHIRRCTFGPQIYGHQPKINSHIFYFCLFVYSVRTVRRDIAPIPCPPSHPPDRRAASLAAPEILRLDSQNNNKWNVVLLCYAIAHQTRIGNNCADTCPERNSKFTFRCASSICRAFRCECTTEWNAFNPFRFESRCIDVQRGIGLDHTRHSLARTRALTRTKTNKVVSAILLNRTPSSVLVSGEAVKSCPYAILCSKMSVSIVWSFLLFVW